MMGKLTQRKTLVGPGSQILGAVHGHASALFLLFDLVLPEPVELARLRLDGDTAGVRVDQVPTRVVPSPAGHDVLCVRGHSREDEQGTQSFDPHGCCRLGGVAGVDARYSSCLFSIAGRDL